MRFILCTFLVLPCAALAAEPAPVQFEEQLIAGDYQYAYGLAAADLDADGDLDLTSADATGNNLYWYDNDGQGKFTRRLIKQGEEGWFERHSIADLNGDKRPDVVVIKNLHGHLVWFENSGLPKDSEWKRHVIATNYPRAYDVAIIDLDGDKLPDVAASSWTGNTLDWFKNPGPNAEGEWKRHPVDEKIGETRTIRVADFNGDGLPDLLGCARVGDLIAWYENTPNRDKAHWPRHMIDDKSHQPAHGEPADFDGDGDFDVVFGLGMLANTDSKNTNEIAWYENVGEKGKGAEWKKHVIAPLHGAFEAVAGDMDSDGDMDVVGSAFIGAGQIAWFENPGNPRDKWTTHMLKPAWTRANSVIIADFNGDKRPDIAGTAERGSNELRWWKNLGKK